MKILLRPGSVSIPTIPYAFKKPPVTGLTLEEYLAYQYNNIIFNVSTSKVDPTQADPNLWNEQRLVGAQTSFYMPSGDTLFESTGAYSLCGYVAPTKVLLHESLDESILWQIHSLAPLNLNTTAAKSSRQLPTGIPVGTTLVRFEYDPPVPAVRWAARPAAADSMTIGVRYTDENDVTLNHNYEYTSPSSDSANTILPGDNKKIKSFELFVKTSYATNTSYFKQVPIIGWTQKSFVAENSRYFYTPDDLYFVARKEVAGLQRIMTIEASHKQVEGKLFIPRPTFQQQASSYIPPFRYRANIIMTGTKV